METIIMLADLKFNSKHQLWTSCVTLCKPISAFVKGLVFLNHSNHKVQLIVSGVQSIPSPK